MKKKEAIEILECLVELCGNEKDFEALDIIKRRNSQTVDLKTSNNSDYEKCRLCDTWKGAKRYKYCPDCGRKIER